MTNVFPFTVRVLPQKIQELFERVRGDRSYYDADMIVKSKTEVEFVAYDLDYMTDGMSACRGDVIFRETLVVEYSDIEQDIITRRLKQLAELEFEEQERKRRKNAIAEIYKDMRRKLK